MAIERLTAPLTPADAARLADLHVRALPRSLISLLGRRYARAFYAFCASAPHETLYAARDAGGAIAEACLMSRAPGEFGARVREATPLPFAAATHPAAWPDLLRALFGGATPIAGPEIVLLFADAAARGRGLGTALVDAALRDARAGGAASMSVVTEDDPANEAIAFYAKNGFADAGAVRLNGKDFRRLVRALDGGDV